MTESNNKKNKLVNCFHFQLEINIKQVTKLRRLNNRTEIKGRERNEQKQKKQLSLLTFNLETRGPMVL